VTGKSWGELANLHKVSAVDLLETLPDDDKTAGLLPTIELEPKLSDRVERIQGPPVFNPSGFPLQPTGQPRHHNVG
jgi:hypothetical protein